MLGLQYFGFEALWSPPLLFGAIALVIGYYYLIGPWRLKRFPEEARATALQQTMFGSGVALLYAAQGGPLNLLGHLMFTFHMLDMSLSYLIAPPLVLLGVPGYIWRFVFSHRGWRPFRWLTHPILTLVAFNMLFSIYHVPLVHDYVMTHFTLHRLFYLVLLVAAFLMWWQITCPVPEWNRLNGLRKMAFVFASGMLLTPACALIIFAGSPMYAVYNDPQVWAKAMGYCVSGDPSQLLKTLGGPSVFSLFSPLEDQQLGGIVMKLIQEVMFGAILAYVFFHWYKKEHADSDTDLPNAGQAGAP
ncbi:cytochrome c oxidase assembly factor CtaG [Paenibacillus beijingensis]|uniref:Cytochrome C oxidase assembly protein n=1 Tax=Paenibacillus beijingensis TaxID=1126833 RepID=A0A0D5NJG5_9BACL|nr:cytochrome c oxidase assembly factor CtaG [Paenibacillus beijingensis]AJY75519.1 cytochrome C oxidase assembly protein [Paenibacillus beijingensis]